MTRRPDVALLIETSNSYARELLQGIRSYLGEHPRWAIHWFEHGRGEAALAWLRHWHGDGIIARVENRRIAAAIRATGLPAVDVSAALTGVEFPRVATDTRATARLAADHLRERGLVHFGYCGDDRFHWSRLRGRHFAEYLAAAGFACGAFGSSRRTRARGAGDELHELADWVRGLPKPAGILAGYDACGRQVLEACRRAGVAVPDDVAVIGVHNDELLCELCDPPLSSVVPDARRAGYEAAALLARLMAGKAVPVGVRAVEPIGVVTRQSTDVVAVHDPAVAAAVRLIRDRACDGITVADVLRAVPVSRSLLERRFKELLGSTLHEQIVRVRLARVRALLATTDLALPQIAERTGFRHAEYLSVAFKRATGVSPTTYRARHQVRC
jgi:LacI family transcriptional regulator